MQDPWALAPTLAAAGMSADWCEQAAALLDDRALTPALSWVAETLTVELAARPGR